MSIFFDFEVPVTGRRFRRAVDEDKVDIELFWKREETDTLFCARDLGSLIELSTLAICMINEDMVVGGFMALSDYPPLPGVDPAGWEIWIRNMFHKYYLSRNTIFIHFMCCKDSVSEYFLEEAFVSIFMNDSYLQQIILVVPPTCEFDCMAKYPTFKKRTVFKHCHKTSDDLELCICLFVAVRQDFCPKLRIRKAVEEDNDEIVKILHKTCDKLTDMYGEFYISELLSRHPESKRTIIVAETPLQSHEKVVGVMCLNPEVNYARLQHSYELAPYRGLVVTSYIERDHIRRNNSLLKTFGDPIMAGKWSPFDRLQSEKIYHSTNADDNTSRDVPNDRLSKIQFRKRLLRRSGNRASDASSDAKHMRTASNTALLSDRSLVFLMDDEPLDYEIVNIDTNKIFTLHEAPSTEMCVSRTCVLRFGSSYAGAQLKKRKSSLLDTKKKELIYEGKPNAFSIELFGMRLDIDDRQAFDLLEAAFECMPGYDYCIIRIPTAQKSFALLQHFCFVPPKPNVCTEYALYVAHRNSVLGRLRIREAEFADIPQITTLFHHVEGKETIWTVEHSIVYTKKHLAYVFLCGTTIIGVGILDPPDHMDLIRTKFVIDSFQRQKYHTAARYGFESGVSMLKTVLVYQAFEPHFAFFAREMIRFSGSSTLIWLTAYRNKWVQHKANGLVSVMTPLPYRVTGSHGLAPEQKEVRQMSKHLISFSAWFTSKKMTSIARLNVDTRIVVVGASKTAISFLYSLLFSDTCTYLSFTNVTLVSTHGLPYLRHSLEAAEAMFPKSHSTSDRFLKSTPFTYYVNVIHGTMVDINRQDKFITLENGNKVYYDTLFLLIGKQYQHPDYMGYLVERDKLIQAGKFPQYVRMDVPSHRESQLEPPVDIETPDNVFFINTIADASNALNSVKSYFWQCDDFKVCVYGASYDAYCCISGLLQMDVNPEDIVFVEPFPPENESKPRIPVFCNSRVDETIRQILPSLRITCHHGFYFDSWSVDSMDLVTSVDFVSSHNVLRVECCAFFYYGKKDLNPHAFVAINKCGLAYDGGILIDHKFQTNDPSVYSAGPATRYFRRYLAQDHIQKFYSSREIGQKLGEQIRNELDPLFTNPDKSDDIGVMTCRSGIFASPSVNINKSGRFIPFSAWEETNHKMRIPKFSKPKVWYCILPGNLQYLEVRPPGPHLPHYYLQSLDYTGHTIETFTSGYFKLHLNNHHIVDGVTCLTPATYSIYNFKKLYGLSAVVLNNVHLRYSAGKIKDLYKFFLAPWSGFLYNDRSEELLTVVKHLTPKNKPFGETMEEVLHKYSATEHEVMTNIEPKLRVRSNFEKAQYFEAISDYVMEWLAENDILFPMYLTPAHIMDSATDGIRVPVFRRRRSTIHKMLAMILK